MMADYDFYVNVYLGNSISEKQFPKLAARAASILQGYERSCTVSCPGPDFRNLAICAMAECLLEHEKRASGLIAATVSNRYQGVSLARQLYRQARIYLDIYTGVM